MSSDKPRCFFFLFFFILIYLFNFFQVVLFVLFFFLTRSRNTDLVFLIMIVQKNKEDVRAVSKLMI